MPAGSYLRNGIILIYKEGPVRARSLEGPAEGYVGTYRAEYASREGAFDPLVKEISRQGAAYRFAWRTARETIYSGIGIEHGPKLVAAWSSPQDSLEVAIYELASDLSVLNGASVAYSDPSGRAVLEHWRADP